MVLFVDIDGFLDRAFAAREWSDLAAPLDEWLDERSDLFEWAGLLEEALGPHQCDVIVRSSWRVFTSDESLRGYLGPLRHRFCGFTPWNWTREGSIREVVLSRRLGADSYRVVLDDDASDFEEFRHQIIFCAPERGEHDARVVGQLRGWLAARPAQQEGAA